MRKLDPPVPADGSCAGCGKDRKPERSEKYGESAGLFDPFCSRSCCEMWHGIESAADNSDDIEELAA